MMSGSAITPNMVREVVGVFHDARKLEAAAEELVEAGFAENRLSVMGDQKAVAVALGHRFEPIKIMEDDPRIPQRAFVLKADRQAAESVAFGLPLYVGAMGGAALVVASGGALAMVLLAAAAGGTIGGGLGAALAGAIGKSHADRLEQSIRQGGVLLWVAVTDGHEEVRASEVLRNNGGVDVHGQEIERTWGEEDPSLGAWNPDPFLD